MCKQMTSLGYECGSGRGSLLEAPEVWGEGRGRGCFELAGEFGGCFPHGGRRDIPGGWHGLRRCVAGGWRGPSRARAAEGFELGRGALLSFRPQACITASGQSSPSPRPASLPYPLPPTAMGLTWHVVVPCPHGHSAFTAWLFDPHSCPHALAVPWGQK